MASYTNQLKIIFWKFIVQPHIVLLSETWLNDKISIKVSNYKLYRKDRDLSSMNPHGGVAILIRKDVPHIYVKPRNTKFVESIFF
jgi:hypothetical protein